MKAIFCLLGLAVLCGTGWSQGCSEIVEYCDYECSNYTGCPPATDCNISNFTPACTGYYYVDAWTICPDGSNCDHCMACVQVSLLTSLLTCTTTGCKDGIGDCCKTCGTVNLIAGQTYQVKVCLSECVTLMPNCGEYSAHNCRACVCLRYGYAAACCVDE